MEGVDISGPGTSYSREEIESQTTAHDVPTPGDGDMASNKTPKQWQIVITKPQNSGKLS